VPFDALALHAVTDELRDTVLDGRVQKAFLADEQALALELYARGQRRWLLASAHPESARAHLVAEPQRRGTERVTPFLLLIRKHVRDTRLVAVEQPPLERVLALRFARLDADRSRHEVTLMLELMGRRSNLVLVDEDGTILDALKRVGRQTNPARPIVPHTRYNPPPALDRLNPRLAASYFALEERVRAGVKETTLSQFLLTHLAGLSPLAAEELAFRATGERRAPVPPAADGLPWQALHAAAAELFGPLDTHAWEPHLLLREGVPADATPYRPRHLPAEQVEPAPTISAAFERAYAAGARGLPSSARTPPAPAAHGLVRAPLERALTARRSDLERKAAALQRALAGAERADELRAAGEAVLASLHAITPGQDHLGFEGREIALDPERTPLENAQRYFDEYTRTRDAGRVVPGLLEATHLELRYVDEMAAQVRLAADAATLEQLRRELVAQGLLAPTRGEAKRGRAAPPRGGYHRVALDGFEALVGTSAIGNERVTFELADGDDLWLHARGVPGSHVILRGGGRAVSAEAIEAAARLAAQHSAAQADALVVVDWTARKHVRKIRGAPPGLVTYTHEQSLRVRPDAGAGG
jgi:predicted ribosome quality control (RQC) complex YloA/Tae2 family protein